MYSVWAMKLKLTTIVQIVEALLERGEIENANQASIILKTAMICQDSGVEKAMEYYDGAHSTIEYVEFTDRDGSPVRRILDEARYTGDGNAEE